MIQTWPHNRASTNEFPIQKHSIVRRATMVTDVVTDVVTNAVTDVDDAPNKSQGLAWLTENAPEDLVGVDRVLLEKTLQCLMLSMTEEAPVVIAAVANTLRALDQEAKR